MHIEPGIVDGAKITLSYATAAGAVAYGAKLAWDQIKSGAALKFILGATISTILVFMFFEILPKYPVGVSEVHFILGSTLFLLFGAPAAAFGLAVGLLLQGTFFAPTDLPQYFINMTTLLVPLFAVSGIAKKVIAPNTAYVDLKYKQAFVLSSAFQAGVIAWVAFWAFYGQGFGASNVSNVMSFGAAYILVVLIEPLVDLAVLAGAKAARDFGLDRLLSKRTFNQA